MTTRAWAHLHLPRLRSGETPDVISVKIPGQKIRYDAWIVLADVEFKVHEQGRQRCIRDGVRNVHAWVVGQPYGSGHRPHEYVPEPGVRKAVYDPFKGGSFVDSETLEPVTLAHRALLIGKDVWYWPYDMRHGRCECGKDWDGDMPSNHSVGVCAP